MYIYNLLCKTYPVDLNCLAFCKCLFNLEVKGGTTVVVIKAGLWLYMELQSYYHAHTQL